ALIAELTDIAQPLAVLRSSGYSIAIVTILARLGSLDLGSLTVFLIALVNWIFGISTTNLQPHQWAILMTPVTGTTTVISLAIVAISGVWWAAYKQPYLAAD
ncbi:MAG TPA: hypothetical protein PKK40_05765, partial [Marmoricola sp.]|nr:hypothetical protein [Marmoricola sp.]